MEFLRSDGLIKKQAPAQGQALRRGGGVGGSEQKAGADSSQLIQQCAATGGEIWESKSGTTASNWGEAGQTWHAQEDVEEEPSFDGV
jgi:hypothetical protein